MKCRFIWKQKSLQKGVIFVYSVQHIHSKIPSFWFVTVSYGLHNLHLVCIQFKTLAKHFVNGWVWYLQFPWCMVSWFCRAALKAFLIASTWASETRGLHGVWRLHYTACFHEPIIPLFNVTSWRRILSTIHSPEVSLHLLCWFLFQ
jgi:hypothetical protein